MRLLCGESGAKSLPNKEPVQERGGEKAAESRSRETEVSEASELQSPVDLACPVRQESEGFWKSSRPGLSSPSDGRRVKASGEVAQPT